MTEPKTMTNEDRLDFLVKTGKLSLEQMAVVEDFCNPLIVHESMDGEIQIALLAGGLGESYELLAEGLVHASRKPKAMISLTSDLYMFIAPSLFGVGSQGQPALRPKQAFELGDPTASEALQVLAAFVGEDDVVQVFVPYRREGTRIHWGEPQRSISHSQDRIAGALRIAVACSHAKMS